MEKQIIIALFFILPISGFAQLDTSLQISGKNLGELKSPETAYFSFTNPLSLNFYGKKIKKNDTGTSLVCVPYKGKAHTAFFCRMEDKLERKVRFPVRMRLGSLDYVDRLEQKNRPLR